MNELVKIESLNPVELFSKDGLSKLLINISKEVKSIAPDIKTKKGRDEIKSLAHKVSKSKTLLDNLGKDLVSDWKSKSKAVDDSRKEMRNFLDDLKSEVRLPLTEWENVEKERIRKHEENIENLRGYQTIRSNYSKPVKDALETIMKIIIDDSWEEYKGEAQSLIKFAILHLKELITKLEKEESDQAELKQLRKESTDRKQKEHEEAIAKKAADKAKREAEEKVVREKNRVDAEKAEIERRDIEDKKAIVKAEKEKIEAEKKVIQVKKEHEAKLKQAGIIAKFNKEEAEKRAVEQERKRVKEKEEKEKQELLKREQDKKHKMKINTAAAKLLSRLTLLNIDEACNIIVIIAEGKVPNVKIHY